MTIAAIQNSDTRRTGDPFGADRADVGAAMMQVAGEDLLLLLRWKDVRTAARDHNRFDSGQRGRVPTPQEDKIRPFRQLPIESNPPEHGHWKEILLPYFRRPMSPEVIPEFETVVRHQLLRAITGQPVEVLRDLALPLQSQALVVLLDTDPDLAAEWQGWGLHALRTDGVTDPDKAAGFLAFIDRVLAQGRTDPRMGLFSTLHAVRFQGRLLTEDEKRGICHLVLAGGRDTVINAVVGTLAHLAEVPDDLEMLRQTPALIPIAVEELFRILSPLPMIGRVCPKGHKVGSLSVAPDARVGLCWAAANRDPEVFDAPMALRIDRKPNPHVAFGAGTHTCLGAPMARLILRTLLGVLTSRVARIEVVSAAPRHSAFGTPHRYDRLSLRFIARGDI